MQDKKTMDCIKRQAYIRRAEIAAESKGRRGEEEVNINGQKDKHGIEKRNNGNIDTG